LRFKLSAKSPRWALDEFPKTKMTVTMVRAETERDVDAIRRVYRQAFKTGAEAKLVDLLRARGKLLISLIAECDGRIIGAVAFSRVTLAGHPEQVGVGLGPLAVEPSSQRKGVGSLLVRAGLKICRAEGIGYSVVLGHPDYYPRFGFIPAGRFGLQSVWKVPEGAFMALELTPSALAGVSGLVRYEPDFDDV
jgi:putative acetyltransferase